MTTSPTTTNRATHDQVLDPDRLSSRFADACNAADLDALAALYTPDAVIVERTGALSRGATAVRAHLAGLLALRPSMTILDSRTVVCGDLALGSSHWRCEATTPDGVAVLMESHSAELSRRQPDGSWLLLADNPWGAALPPSAR